MKLKAPKDLRLKLIFTCLLMVTFYSLYSQGKSLDIGLLVDSGKEQQNELLDEIKSEITTLLSIEYEVNFKEKDVFYCDWDMNKVKTNIQKLLDSKVDVLVAVGSLSSQEAARQSVLNIPVLASIIIDPTLQKVPITKDFTSGIKNLNYTLSPYSAQRDLDKFSEIFPYQNLGILMQANMLEGLPELKDYFDNYFEEEGTSYSLIPVAESMEEVLAAVDRNDFDAIYLGPLFSVQDQDLVIDLIQSLNDRKLPTFALAGAEQCEAGAMASIAPGSNLNYIGRRIALNIQKIMDGKSAEELTVSSRYQEEFVINMETVRKIDYYPSWDVLSQAILINEDDTRIETKWSLLDVIQQALAANLDLTIEEQSVAAGKKDIDIAKSSLLPQVDISTAGRLIDKDRAETSFGSAPQWATTISGALSQIIYSEQARASVDIQKGIYESQLLDLDAARMDIVLESAEAYLNVLKAKTLVRIQRENLSLNRKNLELARIRTEVGYSGPSDLFRWESSIALARTDLIEAEAMLRIAEINLNRLLNRDLNERFLTEEVSLADNYIITNNPKLFRYIDNYAIFQKFSDFMVEEGLRNLPEIRQIETGIGIQERILLSNEREMYTPSIGLNTTVDELFWKAGAGKDPLVNPGSPTANDLTWSIGFQATLPLFTGNARKRTIEKSKIELNQLFTQQDQVKQLMEQRIRNALELTSSSYTSINLSFAAKEAARKNLDLVQDAYSKGLISVIQLIDAQNATIQAEQGAANAIYEFVINLILLERSIGNFYSLSNDAEREAYFIRLETFVNQN